MNITPKKIIQALGGQTAEMAAAFGVLALVTRFYGLDQSGAWSLYTAYAFLATKFREGLLQQAMVREMAPAGARHGDSAGTALVLMAGTELLFTGGAMLWASWTDSAIIRALLQAYPVHAAGWVFYRWRQITLQARLETGRASVMSASAALLLAVTFGSAVYAGASLPACAMLMGGAYAAAALLTPGGELRLASLRFNRQTAVRMLAFGRYGVLREAAGTLASRSLIFLSGAFLPLSDTALVGLAQRYLQLLALPNAAINGLAYAKYCQLGPAHPDFRRLYHESTALLMVFNALAALALIACAPVLIPALHGASWQPAVPVLMVMALQFGLFTAAGNAFGAIAAASGSPGESARLVALTGTLQVVLTAAALPLAGLPGALAAGFFTEAAGSVLASRVVSRLSGLSLLQIAARAPRVIAARAAALKRKQPAFRLS